MQMETKIMQKRSRSRKLIAIQAMLVLAFLPLTTSPSLAKPQNVQEIVSFNYQNGCAVDQDDELKCWGNFETGSQLAPVEVPEGIENVRQIQTSPRGICVVTQALQMKCWGHIPYVPSELSGVVKVSMGTDNVCAIKSGGDLICWGTIMDRSASPHKAVQAYVPGGLQKVLEVRNNRENICVKTIENILACWGSIHNGTTGNRVPIVNPVELGPIVEFDSTENNICALNQEKELFCWGFSIYIPNGNLIKTMPRKLLDVKSIQVVKENFGCVTRTNDELYCWGLQRNTYSGDQQNFRSEIQVPANLGSISSLHADEDGAGFCAIKTDFQVICWGRFLSNQQQAAIEIAMPQGLSTARSLALHYGEVCFISRTFVLKCGALDGQLKIEPNINALKAPNLVRPPCIPSVSEGKPQRDSLSFVVNCTPRLFEDQADSLEYSLDGGMTWKPLGWYSAGASYRISNLQNGKYHKVSIRATNVQGVGSKSESTSIAAGSSLATPLISVSSIGKTSVKIVMKINKLDATNFAPSRASVEFKVLAKGSKQSCSKSVCTISNLRPATTYKVVGFLFNKFGKSTGSKITSFRTSR